MYNPSEILNLLQNPTKEMPQRMDLCLMTTNEGEYVTKDVLTIDYIPLFRVKKGGFWAIWNKEKKEWFGIIQDNLGSSYYSTGSIYCIDGPFKLSERWAQLISFAYNDPNIPLDKILYSSPEELNLAATRILIRIAASMPNGEPDIDMSVVIPLKEEIKNIFGKVLIEKPTLTIFEERKGRPFSSSTLPKCPRGFKSIKIGTLYMLYIEELQQWIGITYQYFGKYYGEENINVSGPYKLTDYYLTIINEFLKSVDL